MPDSRGPQAPSDHPFIARLREPGPIICDGAMGTMLYSLGVPANSCFDEANLSQPEVVKRIHEAYIAAGADIVELGVPFSDPIADGPVIQQAAERALRSGTTLRSILDMVRHLRMQSEIPLVLMAYYNSIHAFGPERFCREAVLAGVDGLIVPDMPPDEAGPLRGPATAAGLQLIFLLAPTSTAERRAFVARQSDGFVYYVSLTGITGAKLGKLSDIGDNVEHIRKVSHTPIAVGFGVTTPEDAAEISAIADGVIVGSAIVKQIAAGQQQQGMLARVSGFVHTLKSAMAARRAL